MKYKTVQGNRATISDEVNKAIKGGYKPQGGLCSTGQVFYQAMIWTAPARRKPAAKAVKNAKK